MTSIEGGNQGGEVTNKIVINNDVLSLPQLQEIKAKTQSGIENLKGDITYEQFNKPGTDKLSLITRDNIKSKDVVEGLKIKFQFPNKEIYLQASAGEVIPGNVIELEAGGKKWIRDENNKEFFYSNNEDGTVNRLIIGSFSNHSKGRYSEVTISKLKGSNQEITKFKNHTKSSSKPGNKEVIDKPHITKEKIIRTTSSKVENLLGNNLSNISDIKDINSLKQGDFINFDFPNKESYIKTSAGSVIPEKINYLKTSDGQIWTRKDGKGEFFNKSGKRLIIGDKKFTRGYPSVQIVDKSESLKVSTYRELLNLPMNYRLQNVSDIIGDSTYLKTGDKIKIDFTKGVGLGKASLGEIMPIEVRSIEKDGKTYTRLLNDETVKGNITKSGGEFLDENMNRLKINTGDNIKITEIKSIVEIEKDREKHLNEINSPEYKARVKSIIFELSKQYKIPTKYIFALLDGENSKQDYLLKVNGKNNSAFGLLQMINITWKIYGKDKTGKSLDRKSIRGQLEAGINYLNYLRKGIVENNKKSKIKMTEEELWLNVITFYHTGKNILAARHDNIEYRKSILKGNAPIKPYIAEIKGIKVSEVTAANITNLDYFKGAREYYRGQLV